MPPKETEAKAQGKGKTVEKDEEEEKVEKFSPEEEAVSFTHTSNLVNISANTPKSLLAEANANKAEANALFASTKYEAAINKYDEAVAVCPNYLDYDLAVLRSNISACHLKLEQWKDAISSATAALDGLDRIEREAALEQERREKERAEEEEVEEEIVSSGASKAAPAPVGSDDPEEAARKKRQEDVLRIRAKALMRRARARSEEGGWQNLAGAEEDYKALSKMTNLAPADRKIVQTQLRVLPPRTKAAQEKETAEMWGKLKDLGNGILKPFGLSTDNFQMVKDEATGGYSMNFNQGK
ncbi:Tetratricopeptide repeat protein 1 [Colletotrichum sp. SAR 10_70]|nr:Tetratricopeptide repeat protein 1 [Colletotrichum sp. SAR 10_71]KAI8203926.1 Tetratricopeptide repeat protein 1 [Colletotrichum sp. SAR 10_70]KAI8204677.1 Tetratricopeptide repeat protein 1 [Colletotrichum sp. SAR 10_65]KAI8261008.1 Tetratricopeptide repeat protein 1 [Colletotrichum sp. SAR 10_77]